MIGGVDVAMTRRDERDDADVICMYFLQFWPDMIVQQWPLKGKPHVPHFRYDEGRDQLPDVDFSIFKDIETYESWFLQPVYSENMIEVKIDFDAISLILGEAWDISSVVAYFYRHGEQSMLPA